MAFFRNWSRMTQQEITMYTFNTVQVAEILLLSSSPPSLAPFPNVVLLIWKLFSNSIKAKMLSFKMEFVEIYKLTINNVGLNFKPIVKT